METIFWQRMTELCEKNGMTPTGICKAIGLSTGNVSPWKRGGIPNQKMVKRIAEYFGVEPEYLVGGTKTPPRQKQRRRR